MLWRFCYKKRKADYDLRTQIGIWNNNTIVWLKVVSSIILYCSGYKLLLANIISRDVREEDKV